MYFSLGCSSPWIFRKPSSKHWGLFLMGWGNLSWVLFHSFPFPQFRCMWAFQQIIYPRLWAVFFLLGWQCRARLGTKYRLNLMNDNLITLFSLAGWKWQRFQRVPHWLNMMGLKKLVPLMGVTQNFRLMIWSNGMEEQRHQCRKKASHLHPWGGTSPLPANRRWKWKREASHYVVFCIYHSHSPYLCAQTSLLPYCPKLHP